MKKFYTLFTAVCLISLGLNAQTIPNGDFESWTSGSPDSWDCTNEDLSGLGGSNVSEVTTDVAGGSSAILLESVDMTMFVAAGIISNGQYASAVPFPPPGTPEIIKGTDFTGTPDSLYFYYKYESVNNDTGVVKLELSNSNGIVGSCEFIEKSTVSTWTKKAIEINYANSETPDTLLILAMSSYSTTGAQIGSKLYLDEISFDGSGGTVSVNENISGSINVFPTPAKDVLNINSNQNISAINIYSITGQNCLSVNPSNTNAKINVSGLVSGIYLITIESGTNIETKRIIIE